MNREKISPPSIQYLSIQRNYIVFSVLFFCIFTHVSFVQALPSPRTVFVQLFEWPWRDVARECEVTLGPQGFSAVQVSPPQEHLQNSENTWWSRYQVVSYKLQSRSGSMADFQNMVQRCQLSGVDVYVDVVLNHMTGVVSGVGSAGTRFTQYDYPGLYEYNDFHFCGRNGNNDIKNWYDLFEIQFCQLVGLADLKSESEKVQNIQVNYLNNLLDIGVAGFRVDAAKHIPPEDLKSLFSKLKRVPYIYTELIVGQGEPIPVQKYVDLSDLNLFAYPFLLGNAFHQSKISPLKHINEQYPPSDKVIVFLENHDLERMESHQNELLLSHLDPDTHRLGTVFMLTWPYGYPQLYSGYTFNSYDQGPPSISPILEREQGCRAPWICQHRRPEVAPLVKFRNETDSHFYITHWWSSGSDQIAFSRGSKGFVTINLRNEPLQQKIPTDMPDGKYKDLLSQKIISIINKKVNVNLEPKNALVLLRTDGWK